MDNLRVPLLPWSLAEKCKNAEKQFSSTSHLKKDKIEIPSFPVNALHVKILGLVQDFETSKKKQSNTACPSFENCDNLDQFENNKENVDRNDIRDEEGLWTLRYLKADKKEKVSTFVYLIFLKQLFRTVSLEPLLILKK